MIVKVKKYFSIFFLLLLISCKTSVKKQDNVDNKIAFKNYKTYYSKNLYPAPLGFVSDHAMMFSEEERNILEEFLTNYEIKTTNEIAVITFDSIPIKDNDIHLYTTKIANEWGVGKAIKNNGLTIGISKYDRAIAISTGLGTEKILTDYVCKQTLLEIIIPELKNEAYYKGVKKGLDTLTYIWDKGEIKNVLQKK